MFKLLNKVSDIQLSPHTIIDKTHWTRPGLLLDTRWLDLGIGLPFMFFAAGEHTILTRTLFLHWRTTTCPMFRVQYEYASRWDRARRSDKETTYTFFVEMTRVLPDQLLPRRLLTESTYV